MAWGGDCGGECGAECEFRDSGRFGAEVYGSGEGSADGDGLFQCSVFGAGGDAVYES
jgi:hypothetical protein